VKCLDLEEELKQTKAELEECKTLLANCSSEKADLKSRLDEANSKLFALLNEPENGGCSCNIDCERFSCAAYLKINKIKLQLKKLIEL